MSDDPTPADQAEVAAGHGGLRGVLGGTAGLVVAGVLGFIGVAGIIVGVLAFVGSSSARDDADVLNDEADELEAERSELAAQLEELEDRQAELVAAAGGLGDAAQPYIDTIVDGGNAGDAAVDAFNASLDQFNAAIDRDNAGDTGGARALFENEVAQSIDQMESVYTLLKDTFAEGNAAYLILIAQLAEAGDG